MRAFQHLSDMIFIFVLGSIQGCDGSILLDDTPFFTGEKMAPRRTPTPSAAMT